LALEPFNVIIDADSVNRHQTVESISQGRRSFLKFDLFRSRQQDSLIRNQLLSELFSDRQFFAVTLDIDKCTLCSACLRLCPTVAMKYQQQQFIIENARCVGCRLCEDACPESALTVNDHVGQNTVGAFPFVPHTCTYCRSNYLTVSSQSGLCPACRVKKAMNLFGEDIGSHSLNFRHSDAERR
jgi:Pyruvate/2-oxoacid:ferredoxin oxidoreductase delta subunit